MDTDPQAKAILRKKLQDITSRYQLETSPGGSNDSKDYSDLVVRAAVALKASPIPGEISASIIVRIVTDVLV